MIPLRFMRFQNISSLVIFILHGDGDCSKVRIDEIKIFGERGEPNPMERLETIEDTGDVEAEFHGSSDSY